MSEEEETMQYAAMPGGVFIPVGRTVPRLRAGFWGLGNHGNTYGVTASRPVSDDLIDIPGTPADEVMADIVKFLATKERYMRVGLTHKRGYLFYGPPGTGKTSMGLMLGRRFIRDADGLVFHVPNSAALRLLTDIVRRVEPGRSSMFLMEEADAFLDDTTALSILDGEQSLAGAVFVAMTNHKKKMPPRIANRPGRFDRVLYVGAPPYRVQVEYFNRLIGRLDEDHAGVAETLAHALDGIQISMGHLREAFVAHILMGVGTEEVRRRFEEMAKDLGKDEPSAEVEERYCESCSDVLEQDDPGPSCSYCNEDEEEPE